MDLAPCHSVLHPKILIVNHVTILLLTIHRGRKCIFQPNLGNRSYSNHLTSSHSTLQLLNPSHIGLPAFPRQTTPFPAFSSQTYPEQGHLQTEMTMSAAQHKTINIIKILPFSFLVTKIVKFLSVNIKDGKHPVCHTVESLGRE